MLGPLRGTAYSLERLLGKGGTGEVFLARHDALGKRVAIKLLRTELARDPDLLDRLRAEARLLARITHPALVGVYDLGVAADGRAFFAMEYVEGEPASALLARDGPFSVERACDIAAQVLDGLAVAHALGIVHRDVKPSNIMIGTDGRARIIDFGIARTPTESDRSVIGTPSYMSPEQISGQTITAASDLYSTACTIFAFVSGHPPFTEDVLEKHLLAPPPSLPDNVPTALEAIVAQALSKDPNDRPRSAEIMAADLRRIAGATHAAPAAKPVRANVRELATTFLGREEELERLGQMFDAGDRFVTLIGFGGAGKTRLAKRFAALHATEYLDAGGAWFVDVSEATRTSDVVSSVARVLGAQVGGRDEDAAVAELGQLLDRKGRMLLVLDNCEQAIGAIASVVARWINVAPALRFLATSRERIGVTGERTCEVLPLSIVQGVQLFVDRARLVRPDWAPSKEDMLTVERIVEALDGIPLAIELGAARMNVMNATSILDRLGKRFDLLSSTMRDATPRQRTLQAAIDWSWSLLEPWEQSALAQCSVFRRGFTLDAAEAIVSLDGGPPILEVIQRLRDKSLVYAQSSRDFPSEIRLGLYESIRDYAAMKLDAADAVFDRHAAYYLAEGATLAEHANRGSREHSRKLALELENLRVVHSRGSQTDMLRAADIILTIMLRAEAPVSAQLEVASSTLERAGVGADPVLVGNVLFARSLLWRMSGATDKMRADSERLLELAREAKSSVTEVQAEMRLAQLAALTGGLPEADVAHAEAAVKASERVEDQKWHRRSLMALGIARYYAGQRDIARKTFFEIARLAEAARDDEARSFACGNLGVLEMELGDFDQAERHLEDATRAEGIHSRAHLYNLATVHHERGDYDRAERAYREVIAGGARNPILSALAMAALGALLCERDEIAEGERLLDEARIAIEKTGPAYTLVVETHRGHLDLALARQKAREGDEASSRAHRASAERRMSDATADRSHMVDDMRTAIRWLERALDPSASRTADAWVIAEDGSWFRRPHGWRVDVGSRSHARRVLAALVAARMEQRGALSVDDVLRAGWPGERVLRRAAEARVYNIIKHLRSAGLRDLIVSLEGGYAVDPAQRVISG